MRQLPVSMSSSCGALAWIDGHLVESPQLTKRVEKIGWEPKRVPSNSQSLWEVLPDVEQATAEKTSIEPWEERDPWTKRGHCVATRGLPMDERVEWLQRASLKCWTPSELRQKIGQVYGQG